MSTAIRATVLLALASSVVALNPSCAPGGNFDLSPWDLQLPTGTQDHPDQVPSSQLQGCSGYQDSGHKLFFTESGDGALVMKAPGDPAKTGCIKFKESQHCRTEFVETHPSSWSTTASQNRMTAQLSVVGGSSICIGQAFQANSNLKPVAEIYYNGNNGDIQVGVEKVATGGSQMLYKVGNVKPGTTFTYELRYEGGKLGIAINGGGLQNLGLFFMTDRAFFKMGNYNQGDDDADIHVFGLTVHHQ